MSIEIPILPFVAVAWLGAAIWIVQDAYSTYQAHEAIWWGLLGLVLGPLAIPLYLSNRLTRRSELRSVGRAYTTSVEVPGDRRPFRSAGLRRTELSPAPTSGVFIEVESGPDAPRRLEVPPEGYLAIRRAVGDELPHAGVLALKEPATSRETHCRIIQHGRHLLLEDQSRFGTKVNGERIRHATVELQPESRIQIGRTTLVVRQARGARSRAA
jgi:hypothetical protein